MNRSLPVRELYAVAHFGNSYEAAMPHEMTEILAEAKFWGFNRFADWFDAMDLYDLYHKQHRLFNLPEAMWARKFANYTIAHQLGYELSLMICPNHVFSTQVTKDNEAIKNDHIFGQLVCPSKPGVTEMILDNYRNLFGDFIKRGLSLRALQACPYDYGGCACDRCQPWIVTFGKLYREIALLAREMFGPLEMGLVGWWWKDEDHRSFTEWANREVPGFFHSLAFHLPYGVTSYAARPLPQGTRERAFVHIAYGEKSNMDAYGHYGAALAPVRLEATVRDLVARGAEGYCAYSEGLNDEINKALLAGLSSGQFDSADAVMSAYVRRHLSDDPDGWCDWLRGMGDYATIDLRRARPAFDKLKSRARPGWRLQQLEERLIMAEADAAVRTRTTWDAERLAAAEAFWAAKERLYRDVWRLGLTRHIFNFESYVPAWHHDHPKVLVGRHVPDRVVFSRET